MAGEVKRQVGMYALALLIALAASQARAAGPRSCEKVELNGAVSAGQEWKAGFGDGWVFRVVPIAPGGAGYSGWDLVVDREQAAGFPDALLVATPPWNSINEREIGTTFGLRAQDAIGWNPRSFHFLTDAAALRESQKLFPALTSAQRPMQAAASGEESAAMKRQMTINRRSSAGEFRILDARIAPGISDAASYAEPWALASPRTPHTLEAAANGRSTALGELHWMRFSVTLWLPAGWQFPAGLRGVRSSCAE